MEGLKTNGASDSSSIPADAPRVRTYLETLLASPEFATSGRKSQLLRYLVERTLAGQASQINEYGIGLDVFERPASFDPRIDSVVRAEVSRLRLKLREYYEKSGGSDPIVIDLPQRGYIPRFTFRKVEDSAPVTGEEPTAPQPRRRSPVWIVAPIILAAALAGFVYWNARSSAPGPLKSLVVLPFENYSKDPQNEYLADGLTEELTNQLAQWRELRVVARTSAFAFKGKGVDVRQIGRQLNVDAVLEGSCVKQADRIKITAQLSRAADGYHLWSRSFEARSEDMLSVQDEMAQAIAVAIHGVGRGAPAPVAAPSPTNPAAHDLYLRASYQLSRHTPESLKGGLELLHSAIKLDPAYVSAYIAIERAEIALIHYTAEPPREGLDRARRALETALQLDPHSADAHGEMADLVYVYDWDWPRAEREFRIALDQGGQATTHSFYGWGLATRGRFDEAQRQFRIAEDLDPLGMGPRFNQAMSFNLERRYSDARRVLQGMLDVNPTQVDAHLILGIIAVPQGDCQTAEAEFGRAAKMYQAPVTKFGLAMASACGGDRAQARRYLAEVEKGSTAFVSPYQLAMGYAYLKDPDTALSHLKESADAREGQILYLKYEPFFDSIRSDPRFVALEKRVGLEP
jgi:TolB-like protein/tetratricopeptide (TPR) repeat protein